MGRIREPTSQNGFRARMTENCCTNFAHNKQFAYVSRMVTAVKEGYSYWESGKRAPLSYQWEAELQLLDVTEPTSGVLTCSSKLSKIQ